MAGDNKSSFDTQSTGAPPEPQGRYVAAKRAGRIATSAGMTPRVGGQLTVTGRVGEAVTVEQSASAAALATGNAITALGVELGGVERIADCLHMTVYVACDATFTAQTAVADGASAEIIRQLGTDFLPTRAAVGVEALPGGAPVEVELMVAVKETI